MSSQQDSFMLRKCRDIWKVPLSFSACPFLSRWDLLVLEVAIPFSNKNLLVSSARKSVALLVCIISGIPKIENSWLRQCMMVLLVISLQGKTKGKWENSSIIVSRYLLPYTDVGSGPLKWIFSRWKGNIAFTSVFWLLLINLGFRYWQEVHNSGACFLFALKIREDFSL